MYADNLAIAAEERNFEEVKAKIQGMSNKLSAYYNQNHIKVNPTKTQFWRYYLKNKKCKRRLNIKWQGVTLKYINNPTYLRVKLDKLLTYKAL